MHRSALAFVSLLVIPMVHAQEVAKADWIAMMTTSLPTSFCQSSQYFRQCFDVTAAECEETALSATRVCIRQVEAQIPGVLRQPGDGRFWGTQIGNCAGVSYEATLAGKRLSDENCRDAGKSISSQN